MFGRGFIFLVSCIFLGQVSATEGKFLLLLGPSGAGKSTIIRYLKEMDERFVYVSPYTTRNLRLGEKDKIHVTIKELLFLQERGALLTVNEIYGIYYATPKYVIDQALIQGQFPLLDWPVDKMEIMLQNYGEQLFTVYISPESVEELERRLQQDGRDQDGVRLMKGREELQRYHLGDYDHLIHMKVLNVTGKDKEVACDIYQIFQRVVGL